MVKPVACDGGQLQADGAADRVAEQHENAEHGHQHRLHVETDRLRHAHVFNSNSCDSGLELEPCPIELGLCDGHSRS